MPSPRPGPPKLIDRLFAQAQARLDAADDAALRRGLAVGSGSWANLWDGPGGPGRHAADPDPARRAVTGRIAATLRALRPARDGR